MSYLKSLDQLIFDNSFVRELPADFQVGGYPRQVKASCFSRVFPSKVSKPNLVSYSAEVAEKLNLSKIFCESNEFVKIFSGNKILNGMDTYAACYGGHQFGNWAGQLGDGRAISLGEVINNDGERLTLQLKGSGLTPYSRTADGLAVLRSSIREFLCSESMYHLGVPTTRALSLVTTGDKVMRDMFYDGNPKFEVGAIVCRVAQSFTRFGNFQILTARNEIDILKKLVDYTIKTDFPQINKNSNMVYLRWFEEIVQKTLLMVLDWERVGFVHGVMNTDNMSILGLTIDYGPYGWLEGYDPEWTPNTTDANGRRYCFSNQAKVALWNLWQLGQALFPVMDAVEPFEEILNNYSKDYDSGRKNMLAKKLGLKRFEPEGDQELIQELFIILQLVETDMTIFFRKLASIKVEIKSLTSMSNHDLMMPLLDAYYFPDKMTLENIEQIGNWVRLYVVRLEKDNLTHEERCKQMNQVNPKYILRNYLSQLAIDKAEQGDYTMVNELLEVMRKPYDEQSCKDKFALKRPEWAREKAGCSMLSCSS